MPQLIISLWVATISMLICYENTKVKECPHGWLEKQLGCKHRKPTPDLKPLAWIQLAPDFHLYQQKNCHPHSCGYSDCGRMKVQFYQRLNVWGISLGLGEKLNPLAKDIKSLVLTSIVCKKPSRYFIWLSLSYLFLVPQAQGIIPWISFLLDS